VASSIVAPPETALRMAVAAWPVSTLASISPWSLRCWTPVTKYACQRSYMSVMMARVAGSSRPKLSGERGERAVLPLPVVYLDHSAPPGLPLVPRGQIAKHRLLLGEDLLRLVFRHCQQQIGLAVREVVEELALAGGRHRADVVQPDARHAVIPDDPGRAFHDPLPGGGSLGGQRSLHDLFHLSLPLVGDGSPCRAPRRRHHDIKYGPYGPLWPPGGRSPG